MKRTIALLLALLLACAAACGKKPGAVVPETLWTEPERSFSEPEAAPEAVVSTEPQEEIMLFPWQADLFIGQTLELKAFGAANIRWSSSDTAVATVDAVGVVTAQGAGTATITASSAKDSAVCAETIITVGDHVTGLVLEEQELVLLAGSDKGEHTLAVQILPETALIRELHFVSSDEGVLTVDGAGKIRAVAAGAATVTITSADDACDAVLQVNVTVKQGASYVELSETSATLYPKERVSLTARILPEDAIVRTGVWSSSDEAVATVTEKGVVTAKAAGTAFIRFTANDGSGIYGECRVDVVIAARKIVLDPTRATLLVGASESLSTVSLSYTVSPDDTSYTDVVWTSSDERVATVDGTGLVRGVSAGTATITAATTDPRQAGKVKATCTVTVGNAVTAITLEGGDPRIQKGKTMQLTATVSPEKPFNDKLRWSSSDESILKVDGGGTVRALSVGTATITAVATDGSGVTASQTITVYQPVKQLKFEGSKTTVITEDDAATLTVSALPEDASDKTLLWTSDNAAVATVDDSGKVTANRMGQCTITATAADGSGESIRMTVVVEPKIPLAATNFERDGRKGVLDKFAVTFRNLTQTRTIKFILFDIVFTYQGTTCTERSFYTDTDTLRPGAEKRIGWWEQIGDKLTDCSDFHIYLRQIQYSDGTWVYFDDQEAPLGSF